MDFTVDLSGLPPDVANGVIRKIRHDDRARFDLDLIEQQRTKRLMDQVVAPGWNNNIGRQTMQISPGQWAAFMRVYGQHCWADPDFAPWVLKQEQHADFRVKDVGTKIQSGYNGKSKA
jgi:hypothetical protein